MKKAILILLLALFLLPTSLATPIFSSNTFGLDIHSNMQFGPGSEIPFYDPIVNGEEGVWISEIEPLRATWTFYDSHMHKVYEETHPVRFKRENVQGHPWVFADETTFTIPAFASKGIWYAKCRYEMADGTTWTSQGYYGIEVTSSGTIFENLFIAPWYAFNIKFPPIFWFPLILVWAPAIFVLACAIFTHSITGVVDVVKGAVEAGRRAKRKWTTR